MINKEVLTDQDPFVAEIQVQEKALRDRLAKERGKHLDAWESSVQKFLAHVLWVSATVFAVIVIAGSRDLSVLASAVYLACVASNVLCILFCTVSLYEASDSADRIQDALAKQIGNPLATSLDHRKVKILIHYQDGKPDPWAFLLRRKIFGFCRKSAYVFFVLTVIGLSVFAFVK